MSISKTTLRGSVVTPAGMVAALKSVTFTLSGSDSEAGLMIAQNEVDATVNAETGSFEVTLWPNDRGLLGNTSYSVSFVFRDGSSLSNVGTIYVRYSPSPREWEDVLFEQAAADLLDGWSIVVLSRVEYAALPEKAPLTAYFLKG